MECNCEDWNCVKSFLKTNYPKYSPGVEFGYYGQTSVCMPRFYVYLGESAWEYSLVIIAINFLSFFFIAVSYICMFIKSKKTKIATRNNHREKQHSRMQGAFQELSLPIFYAGFLFASWHLSNSSDFMWMTLLTLSVLVCCFQLTALSIHYCTPHFLIN